MNRSDEPAKQPVPFGVNGQREVIEPDTTPGDNSASYNLGFPPITMILKAAGGLPPKGQDMNQILFELSALSRWFSAGAIASYDSTFSTAIGGYPKGAEVLGSDFVTRYFNTVDANTSNPNTGGAGWFNLTTGYLKTANNLSDLASPQTALTNLGLTGIGIGLSTQPTIVNFDWQTFVYASGANYLSTAGTWVNTPSGVVYGNYTIGMTVNYITGNNVSVTLRPNTVSNTNFKVYEVISSGIAGSRTFTVREIPTSANPVPITGGGTGAITASAALANLGGIGLSQLTGVVGTSRNAKMSITAASATATFTADELIVQTTLGGLQYKLSSFSKTINLATTGAGGMDTGTVPVSGFVAIYAIYNPTTQVSALLAVNATSVRATEVYTGANMPAGYTASALVSVSPISSSQFKPSYLNGRKISFPLIQVVSATASMANLSPTSIALAAPLNASAICGNCKVGGTSSAAASFSAIQLTSDSLSSGYQEIRLGVNAANGVDTAGNFSIDIITPQTLYYRFESDMTSNKAGSILISSYLF